MERDALLAAEKREESLLSAVRVGRCLRAHRWVTHDTGVGGGGDWFFVEFFFFTMES